MGQLTNYTEKKILDHVLKTASYTPPATIYLGLSTADPTHDGSGWVNPTYTGYARKSIAFNAAAARALTQNGIVTFDICSGGSSTVPYWGLWDAPSGGNLLAYGLLSTPKNIVVGNTPSVADQQVVVSFNAGAIFTTFANSVLNWLFGGGTLNQPTNVKVGLSTTTPTDAGANITEPVGNGYAQANFNTWKAASGNPEVALNNGTITLGPPVGSWGTITYGILYLDTTPAFYGTVPNQIPDNGDTVEWLDSQFSISVQ